MLRKNEKTLTRYSTPPPFNFPKPMSTQIENPSFDDSYFLTHLPQIYRSVLKDFRKTAQSFIFFHAAFLAGIAAESIFFIPFLSSPTMTAFALGAFFLTVFSYLVLHFFFQARKPERLVQLKELVLQSCRRHIATPA